MPTVDPLDPDVLDRIAQYLASLDPQNVRFDGYQVVKPTVQVVHHGRFDGFDFQSSGLKVEMQGAGSWARAFVIEADEIIGDLIKVSNGTPVFLVMDKDNVWFIHDAIAQPSANPTDGVSMFASSGHMRFRDPDGFVWPWPNGNLECQVQDMFGWTFDPALSGGTGRLTEQTIYMQKLYIPRSNTISSVMFNVTNATAALATNSYVGLYNTSGTQLAVSADISTTFESTGVKTVNFTTPYAATPGYYYTALLAGDGPGLGPDVTTSGSSAGLANANLGTSSLRFAIAGTGQTSLPSSITMASLVSAAGINPWVGVK